MHFLCDLCVSAFQNPATEPTSEWTNRKDYFLAIDEFEYNL